MLTPCEVAVKTVSPAIRSLIAQNLLEKHNLNETQVANILGITQSAVSKYSNKVRGTTISIENIPEVQLLADQMVTRLLANPVEQTELMRLFCQTCRIIRQKGLMCPLCQQNQKVKIDGCDFCNQF
jgi:predicted transcriptional regulator